MSDVKYKDIDLQAEMDNMTLVPFGSRLVVKELEVKQVGLIHVPETSTKKEMQTNQGFVLAVGDDVDFCDVGDEVYYGKYSGAWFDWNGHKYRIMNEEDLLGRVK